MIEPYFKPWVGKDYGRNSQFGVALMILGESHYVEPQTVDSPQLTVEMIGQISRGEWPKRFHTIIYRLFPRRTGSSETVNGDFKSFWDSLLFYNYVQQSVGLGPRIPPGDKLWLESKEPFFTVLSRFKPDCILILGARLWKALSDLKCIEGTSGRTCKVPLNSGRKIISAVITHPSSSRFKYDTETEVASRLLTDAKSEIGNGGLGKLN